MKKKLAKRSGAAPTMSRKLPLVDGCTDDHIVSTLSTQLSWSQRAREQATGGQATVQPGRPARPCNAMPEWIKSLARGESLQGGRAAYGILVTVSRELAAEYGR